MLPFDLKNSTVELEVRTKRKEHGNVKSIHPDECPALWKTNPALANTKEVFFSITDNAYFPASTVRSFINIKYF